MINILNSTIDKILSFDLNEILRGSFLSTMILIFILIIISLIINIQSRKALKNPLETPKGIFFLMVVFYQFIEKQVIDIMGERSKGLTPYIITISVYLFSAFIFGLTGLPSPVGNLAFPLILSFMTFVLIHYTAIKYNRIHYFHRFVEPIAVMLPINLLTMWAPLLSLTLRLFGNALAGYCIMNLVYFACTSLGSALSGIMYPFGMDALTPWGPANFWTGGLITPVLHAYFDLFSGFVQTMVFVMLTMIFINQEQPEEAEEMINTI